MVKSTKQSKSGESTPSKKATSSQKDAASHVWTRHSKGGRWAKAVDRDVDEAAVVKLLNKRMAAKSAKNFEKADEYAARLQEQGICYVDDKLEWYTRALSFFATTEGKQSLSKKVMHTKKKRPPGHIRKRMRKGAKRAAEASADSGVAPTDEA